MPEQGAAVALLCETRDDGKRFKLPFDIIVDDPAGNSYVENSSPLADPV